MVLNVTKMPISNTKLNFSKTSQSSSNKFGGYGSQQAQTQALQRAIQESQQKHPEQFKDKQGKEFKYVSQVTSPSYKPPVQQAQQRIQAQPIELAQKIQSIQAPTRITKSTQFTQTQPTNLGLEQKYFGAGPSGQTYNQYSGNIPGQIQDTVLANVAEVGQGTRNQLEDYYNIANLDYEEKSLSNRAIISSLEGDFDEAGRIITSNPQQLAGELLVEIPLTLIPVGPVTKAAKIAGHGLKKVAKYLLARPDIIKKGSVAEKKVIEKILDKPVKDITKKETKALENWVKKSDKQLAKNIKPSRYDKRITKDIKAKAHEKLIKDDTADWAKAPKGIATDPKSIGYVKSLKSNVFNPPVDANKATVAVLKAVVNDSKSSKAQKLNAKRILEQMAKEGLASRGSTFDNAKALKGVGVAAGGAGLAGLSLFPSVPEAEAFPFGSLIKNIGKQAGKQATKEQQDVFTQMSKTVSDDINPKYGMSNTKIKGIKPGKSRRFDTYQNLLGVGDDVTIYGADNIPHIVKEEQIWALNKKQHSKNIKANKNLETLKDSSILNQGEQIDPSKIKRGYRRIKEKVRPTNISSDIKLINPERHGFPNNPFGFTGLAKVGGTKNIYLNKFSQPGAGEKIITDTIIHEDTHNVLFKMGLDKASWQFDNLVYRSPGGVRKVKKTLGINKKMLAKQNSKFGRGDIDKVAYDKQMGVLRKHLETDRMLYKQAKDKRRDKAQTVLKSVAIGVGTTAGAGSVLSGVTGKWTVVNNKTGKVRTFKNKKNAETYYKRVEGKAPVYPSNRPNERFGGNPPEQTLGSMAKSTYLSLINPIPQAEALPFATVLKSGAKVITQKTRGRGAKDVGYSPYNLQQITKLNPQGSTTRYGTQRIVSEYNTRLSVLKNPTKALEQTAKKLRIGKEQIKVALKTKKPSPRTNETSFAVDFEKGTRGTITQKQHAKKPVEKRYIQVGDTTLSVNLSQLAQQSVKPKSTIAQSITTLKPKVTKPIKIVKSKPQKSRATTWRKPRAISVKAEKIGPKRPPGNPRKKKQIDYDLLGDKSPNEISNILMNRNFGKEVREFPPGLMLGAAFAKTGTNVSKGGVNRALTTHWRTRAKAEDTKLLKQKFDILGSVSPQAKIQGIAKATKPSKIRKTRKTTNQSLAIKQAINSELDKGMINKQDIYTNVVNKLGVPRATVRKVARDLRTEIRRKLQ